MTTTGTAPAGTAGTVGAPPELQPLVRASLRRHGVRTPNADEVLGDIDELAAGITADLLAAWLTT